MVESWKDPNVHQLYVKRQLDTFKMDGTGVVSLDKAINNGLIIGDQVHVYDDPEGNWTVIKLSAGIATINNGQGQQRKFVAKQLRKKNG